MDDGFAFWSLKLNFENMLSNMHLSIKLIFEK